jgi:Uma2 family endonuclease
VHAPAGGFTSSANAEIISQLRAWWKTHRRGQVFDCNCGFFLKDGSMLSPDAAYVSPEKLAGLSKEEMARILYLAPNFIIELLSRTDTLKSAKEKMEFWVENGVELGWLIDPYRRNVLVYRAGGDVATIAAGAIEGEGPVEGFTLDLAELWRCYEL